MITRVLDAINMDTLDATPALAVAPDAARA
jgi:hypothetical protein